MLLNYEEENAGIQHMRCHFALNHVIMSVSEKLSGTCEIMRMLPCTGYDSFHSCNIRSKSHKFKRSSLGNDLFPTFQCHSWWKFVIYIHLISKQNLVYMENIWLERYLISVDDKRSRLIFAVAFVKIMTHFGPNTCTLMHICSFITWDCNMMFSS